MEAVQQRNHPSLGSYLYFISLLSYGQHAKVWSFSESSSSTVICCLVGRTPLEPEQKGNVDHVLWLVEEAESDADSVAHTGGCLPLLEE